MPISTDTGAAAAPVGLFSRFLGIITAPTDTYRSVDAHPKWLGMLVLVTVIVALFAALPMTTEAGKEAALKQQIEQTESFGFSVGDEQYEAMRRNMAFAPYTTAAFILIVTPIFMVVVAGILFVIFNAILGGEASFKQLFAVIVHAGVISALQQIFTGPLNYFRGAVTSATNLAALLPMVDPTSFLGRVLAATDLFLIWYVLVLAIGIGVLYRRRTQSIAIGLYAVYAVLVLGFAAVMSRLGGA